MSAHRCSVVRVFDAPPCARRQRIVAVHDAHRAVAHLAQHLPQRASTNGGILISWVVVVVVVVIRGISTAGWLAGWLAGWHTLYLPVRLVVGRQPVACCCQCVLLPQALCPCAACRRRAARLRAAAAAGLGQRRARAAAAAVAAAAAMHPPSAFGERRWHATRACRAAGRGVRVCCCARAAAPRALPPPAPPCCCGAAAATAVPRAAGGVCAIIIRVMALVVGRVTPPEPSEGVALQHTSSSPSSSSSPCGTRQQRPSVSVRRARDRAAPMHARPTDWHGGVHTPDWRGCGWCPACQGCQQLRRRSHHPAPLACRRRAVVPACGPANTMAGRDDVTDR
jgi:hypothetical protein